MLPGDARHRLRLRLLFLVTIILVGIQSAHKEVYPSLQAPKFSSPGNLVRLSRSAEKRVVELIVTFGDGSRESLRIRDLLDRTHFKQRGRITSRLLRIEDASGSPVARAWLREEVPRRFAARGPTRIEVRSRLQEDPPPGELLFSDDLCEPPR